MQSTSDLSSMTATGIRAFFEKIKNITGEQIIEIEGSKHYGTLKRDYRATEYGDIRKSIERANTKRAADLIEETTASEDIGRAVNIGLHETNLYSVFSAVLLTEGYLLPGDKQRKLFAIPQTGESHGTTGLNKKYVSTHYLKYFPHSAIGRYLENSAGIFRTSYTDFNKTVLQGEGTQVDQELYEKLSTIPVSVVGEGAIRQTVWSDFKEAGFKAVRILTIGVDENKINEVKKILSELGQEHIHVVSNTEIKRICGSSYGAPNSDGSWFSGNLKQLETLLPTNYIKDAYEKEILNFILKASLGPSVVLGVLGAVALYIGEKEENNFLVKLGTSSLALGVVIGLVASAALMIRAVTPDSKLEEPKATEIKTSTAAIKA